MSRTLITRLAILLLVLSAGTTIGFYFNQQGSSGEEERLTAKIRQLLQHALRPEVTTYDPLRPGLAPSKATTPEPAAVAASLPAFTLSRVVFINAGGPALRAADLSWGEDTYYQDGGSYVDESIAIENSAIPALYQSERSGSSFGYRIPVPQPAVYMLRLHFAEIYWSAPGQRVFDVVIEDGAASLKNFDIVAAVGPHRPTVQEFQVPVVDGVLSLDFSSSVDRAQVAAIEVLATDLALPQQQATTAAQTYFLAPDGASERCGTERTPCSAPQYLPTLPPGAQVLAAAGAYPEWLIDGRQGTSDEPITIKSASGERDIGLYAQLRITNSSYLVVDGLALDGGNLWIEQTEYVTVRNSRISNAPDDGIRYHRALATHISQVEVREPAGSCVAAHVREQDRQGGNPYSGSDLQRYSFGTIIEGSQFLNCGAQGIFVTSMSPIIRNNQIINIGQRDQDPRVHGIYSKSENALIEGNVVDGAVHNGISIRNSALVRSNIVRNAGLDLGPSDLHGGACYSFYNDGPQNGGLLVFENNVCYKPGPRLTSAFRIDGTTTEGSDYTFVLRNNTAVVDNAPGVELAAARVAKVYLQHNIFVRQSPGELVIGDSSVAMGTNLLRAGADEAGQIFVDAASGNFELVNPVRAAAPVSPADWTPDAASPSLADLRSAAVTDFRGTARGGEPCMGAFEK